MQRKQYTSEDFTWTQWDVHTIERVAKEVIARKKEKYEEVKRVPSDNRTFENTVLAIERSSYDIIDKIAFIEILLNASPIEAVRDTAKKSIDFMQKAFIDIEYDEEMYRAVKEFSEKEEAKLLQSEDKKLFSDMMRDYRRMGFELPVEARNELKENLKQLSEWSNEFSKNINDHRDSITVSVEDLAALPESYRKRLKKTDDGMFIVGIEYPEYNPFMQNCPNSEKRKELAQKFLRRGGFRNMELLQRILRLRHRNARILGYENHAAFVVEPRMAKHVDTVEMFIQDLMEKLQNATTFDISELTKLKHEKEKNNEPMFFSDIPYYLNLHKTIHFKVDDEKVREYFPFDIVKKGMFEIYSKLFSISFERMRGLPTWHEDCEVYVVRDFDGSLLSYFILDLYPRDGKYSHAAVFPVIPGFEMNDAYNTPLVVMMTNFPKPMPDNPSLLSHREVEVFFHEFGHVMHGVLTRSKYASQSGTCVARDFVEAPSQMFENWVWDKEMLASMSGYYKNLQEKLPFDMLNNLIKAKNHMIGYGTMRQLVLALFDFTLHNEEKTFDITELYNELVLEYTSITMPQGNLFASGFGHLMGYDAGYYGYLWSKVYSSDMFTRFKNEGLLNTQTGNAYRRWILEKGGSQEEIDILRAFLGREPNNEAFLDEIGLRS